MTKAGILELDWDILPHPPYSPALTTSSALQQSAQFPSTTTLSSKIGWTTSRPKRRIKNLPER
jgi:hypothetical protein